MDAPRRLVRSVLGWPFETQQGSRRNALVASTALTQRRRERDEVEEFLATRAQGASSAAEDHERRRDVI